MKAIKKIAAVVMACAMVLSMVGCGKAAGSANGTTYKVGICNYVDDASLNQIVENIQNQLNKLGSENNVTFEISLDNCNADSNVMSQIISNFIADKSDVMVAIDTPVAMSM